MKRRRLKFQQWSASDFAVVVVSLAAPALGGSTQLWAQTVVIGAAALLILMDPPRRPLPRALLISALVLLGLGLIAFLPATWFGGWPGRETLLTELKVPLSNTLSPQPWVTLEWFALLAASVLWAAYLVSREWTMARPELLRLYVAGLAILVGAALILHLRGASVPLWTPLAGVFGFFPNRNQMGNLLALGGIVALALAFRAFRRGGNARYWWTGSYVVLLVAVVVNFSRAGVVMFFGGSVIWLFWANWHEQRSHTPLLGAAAVMALLMGTLLVGGSTVERLLQPLTSKQTLNNEGRLKIYADTLPLLREASWHGAGLGSFDPLFASYRKASRAENRAIHPESDWIWWGIELGWLAPLIILLVISWWLWRHWPDRRRPEYDLSVALALVVILFALHGVVDVSAHRIGSLWPALFLGALLPRRRHEEALPPPRQRWRLGGLALLALSGGWAACLSGVNLWPTSAAFERARAEMGQVNDATGLEKVITKATEGLRYAPLHWQLYFYRAKAALLAGRPILEIRYDFARAKFLEPNLSSVPFEEGELWLMRIPMYALGPWREALERASPELRPGYFDRMLRLTADLPEIRAEVPPLAQGHPDLLLAYLRVASPTDFMIEVERQLLQFPHLELLAPAQRQQLFSLWAEKGNLDKLLGLIEANPDWLPDSWRGYATALAKNGRFEKACKVVSRFCPKPSLPILTPSLGEGVYADRLKRNSTDFVAGFALYQIRMQAENLPLALQTLQGLTAQPGCPGYFHYLRARLQTRLEHWAEAWKSWAEFLRQTP